MPHGADSVGTGSTHAKACVSFAGNLSAIIPSARIDTSLPQDKGADDQVNHVCTRCLCASMQLLTQPSQCYLVVLTAIGGMTLSGRQSKPQTGSQSDADTAEPHKEQQVLL